MRIHASVGELPRQTIFALARLAQSVRPGRPRPHHDAGGTLAMTRALDGQVILHRGPLPEGKFAAAKSIATPARIEREGPALWKELQDGASTPEARLALIYGMTPRLPCGKCRTHWTNLLQKHPPEEACQSSAAYERYIWDRHNDVNRSLGKPELAFPEARN